MTTAAALDLSPRHAAPAPALATVGPIAPAAATDVQFAIVSDRDGLARLGPEWNALFEHAGRSVQVFQTFAWISHWFDVYGADDELAIITGRRDGRLVVVWPLVVSRSAGLRIVSWAGAPVSQYGDVVLDDCADPLAVLMQSWDYLTRALKPDLARLGKVRADASVAPLMTALGALATHRDRAPYLDLASAPTFAAYEQRWSSKAKKNRRRFMRRLEERGPVSIETFNEGTAARDRVGVALAMKRAWLRERGRVSAAFADDRFEAFFTAVAADAGRPTGTRISTLLTNGEIAAAEIAFACKGRLAVHVIAYNLKFEKLSTGSLLVEASIRRAKEAGIDTFDFLAPGDEYKMDWADGAVDVIDWAAPLSAKGRAYARLYLGLVRPQLKRTVAAMPLALRRAMSGAMSVVSAMV